MRERREVTQLREELRAQELDAQRLRRDLALMRAGIGRLVALGPWCDYWKARALLAEERLAKCEPKREERMS